MKNLVEVDFHDFRGLLARAAREGHRLERTDRKSWADYLRKHDVPEGACLYHAKQHSMSGEVSTVILNGTAKHDGLYLYSDDDLFCLRYIVEPAPEPEAAAEPETPPAAEPAEAAEAQPAAADAEPAPASAEAPASEAPAAEGEAQTDAPPSPESDSEAR
ncbi:hypothetical protein ABI59_15625 [Acidobacteria bacterium Mor1]|nr:hypothetical protein ABI59_15625 [Acidobacteria bacterium Mor1]